MRLVFSIADELVEREHRGTTDVVNAMLNHSRSDRPEEEGTETRIAKVATGARFRAAAIAPKKRGLNPPNEGVDGPQEWFRKR